MRPDGKVSAVRATFRAELAALMGDLAGMARLAAEMVTTASIALHQEDSTLATRVVTECHRLHGLLEDTERRCVTLLALQAPVAGDLRVVVAAIRVVGHLQRMDDLARHIALISQRKHPNPMASDTVRPVLARMSLLASQQAEHAATAIEHQDPLSGCQLATADNELDALLAHLRGLLVSPDWSHGVEQAVDAALIGRYYERFGDHAVAIAAQAGYICTGRSTEPRALNVASSPAPVNT